MRTEAGNLPESLVFPIRNGLGVSNDRFGFNPKGFPTACQNGKIQDRQGRGRRERTSVRDRVQDPKATPQIAHYHRPNHAGLIL